MMSRFVVSVFVILFSYCVDVVILVLPFVYIAFDSSVILHVVLLCLLLLSDILRGLMVTLVSLLILMYVFNVALNLSYLFCGQCFEMCLDVTVVAHCFVYF